MKHLYEHLLDVAGMTAAKVESLTNIGSGTISRAIKRHSKPTLEILHQLEFAFLESPEAMDLVQMAIEDVKASLLKKNSTEGEETPIKPTAKDLQHLLIPTPKKHSFKQVSNEVRTNDVLEGVPVYDVEFAGGDRASSFFWEGEHPIAHLNIPEVFGCDSIIRARGESMSPKINPRDWVGIREVKDFRNFIPWGHIYGIETAEFGLFKYVQKSEEPGCIHMVSENPQYAPQDLPLDKILRLWQVRVVIPISQILLLA